MPDEFDLSILIVNWNGRDMLRALLESIADTQGDLNLQTIVVDNGSNDGSADMLTADFPDVTLIRNSDNRGFARANNQAAAVARAPLLFLLNNDTIVRAGALQAMIEFLRAHPDVLAVGPKLIGGDGMPQRSGRNLPTPKTLLHSIQFLRWTGIFNAAYNEYRRGNFNPDVSSPIPQIAAAALMIRTAAFNDCRGFDEEFPFGVEDVDLCARLAKSGSIYYLADAAIDHLGRVSSRANRGFVYRGYECGWARYLKKHHDHRTTRNYKILVTLDMPIRILVLALEWFGQEITGRSAKADRTRGMLRAATEFALTGLPAFWRA